MKAEDLRALQAPLKAQYREKPESARVPARAEAQVLPDSPSALVKGGKAQQQAGLHPAGGGDGSEACSADMLLEALVACAGVTLKAVATAMEVELKDARVVAEGWWDARGTLGLDRSVPVGLTEVTLTFHLDSPAETKTLLKLIELTERFCVIYQTLKAGVPVSTTLEAA